MGSSKKHKKHKEKDREKRSHDEAPAETAAADQRPLKLVLKVGSTSTTVDRSPSLHSHTIPVPLPPDEEMAEMPLLGTPMDMNEIGSSKKPKKKKSKKKHRKHSHHHRHHHHRHKSTCHHSKSSSNVSKDHPEEMASSVDMEVEDQKVPISELLSATSTPQAVPVPPLGDQVPAEPPKSPLKVSLKSGSKILYSNYLHLIVKTLQKRDCQDFFAWPVTEVIAPGYYSIIQRPMDFSTIHKKIDLRIYETLQELKIDVKLMCDNAMTYNGPDTIYFKAAKKLWHFAKEKVFSRDSLNEMRSAVSSTVLEPALAVAPQQMPPFLQNEVATVGTETTQFPPVADAFVSEPAPTEAEDDEDAIAAKILEQARSAAATAAQRLTLAKPNGAHFSFIRQRSDGSTSLGIVGAHPSHDRYLKLENIVGKLPEGTPYLPTHTEPESNRVKLIESVETTPFSSYLPSIDSSKSKLTQEETSLLLSTYGDEEVGIPYTKSILEFSSESDYLIRMADNLLDILTQGQHSKVLQSLREEKSKESTNSQEGDEETKGEKVVDEVSNQLEDTQVLLENLEKIQRKRLSSTSKPTAPASEELELASVLTSKLTQIIGTSTTPVDLTDMASIRKAMGVQVKKD